MKQKNIEQKEQARKFLKDLFEKDLKKGIRPICYTVLKHVSTSGMLRHIDVFYIGTDRKPILLNWYIEQLGLFNRAKHYDSPNADSLRVSGCGMDMGFHVVSVINSALYPYESGKSRAQQMGFNDIYLIKQEWL